MVKVLITLHVEDVYLFSLIFNCSKELKYYNKSYSNAIPISSFFEVASGIFWSFKKLQENWPTTSE